MMREFTLSDLTLLAKLASTIAATVPFERTPEKAVDDLISLGMKNIFHPDQLEDIALSTDFMRHCVPGSKRIPSELNIYVNGDLFRYISAAARKLLNSNYKGSYASPCMLAPLQLEAIDKLHPFDVIRNSNLAPLADETMNHFLKPVLFYKYQFSEKDKGFQSRDEARIIASVISGQFVQILENYFGQVRLEFQKMLGRPISMVKKMRYVYALGLLDAVSLSVIAPAKNVDDYLKRGNGSIEKYMRTYSRDVRQSIKPVKRELSRLLLDKVRSGVIDDENPESAEERDNVFQVADHLRVSMLEFYKYKQIKEGAECP